VYENVVKIVLPLPIFSMFRTQPTPIFNWQSVSEHRFCKTPNLSALKMSPPFPKLFLPYCARTKLEFSSTQTLISCRYVQIYSFYIELCLNLAIQRGQNLNE
jgi:hypothetical protein